MDGVNKKRPAETSLLPPEQEVESEEKVLEHVVKNLNYFRSKYQIGAQKDLAEILEISPSQLTKILKKEQMPPLYPLLVNITKRFHYSIDEFLFTDIRTAEIFQTGDEEDLPAASYMKFQGAYQVYYFNTSSFREKERRFHGNSLKSGVLYMEKDCRGSGHKIYGILDLSKDSADRYIRDAVRNGRSPESSVLDKIKNATRMSRTYFGGLDLSSKHIYMDLRSDGVKDAIHMIFHRPESNSGRYIGGLGTMISVSRGAGAAPSVQYVAIVKDSLDVSEEELASYLLMRGPGIVDEESVGELAAFVEKLYSPGAAEFLAALSGEQKKAIVKSNFNMILRETLERNLSRDLKVSLEDDEEFYHYIKRTISGMRAERK
ncbi:hypothetical protein B5F29_02785 [Lachnoclostridium sp. An196]|uniref:helix-turn-helix domain-containing protein n=1 Tax=Lachnoclostridium sp. An196 TaxID=1965583 RepID=UPI000B37D9A7|nr:helix-turn-helix transcriptional regulator [Lachnoclostridium sp. An196]OUP21425.1 hypothetical protein B5F29_02785 [Lachnoclostridium sp. An196]